ncbi:MAG: acyl-CoA carboxylase subunit beta [Chlamydiota bacterium]|nr:acyl-CoA carboxylase subunit beta [Chlamydiota bacterium]
MKQQDKVTAPPSLLAITEKIAIEESHLKMGGGKKGHERQKRHGRLSVRERLNILLDDSDSFFELQLWSGYQMYPEVGDLPASGVITGIGEISGHTCMVIANDATVKAGAMFPQSIKKVLRAQSIAYGCKLPIIYLVDSSGVYLPLQDEIFPDEDDFGRIFRNNAVLSAQGIPQIAAIMGNCIAGGGYLPVLCDKLLMTEGSGLYLAGPALVKAAIGQVVDNEELGGAKMHAEISGTVDFLEKDDTACLEKIRSLVELMPNDPPNRSKNSSLEVENYPYNIYEIVSGDNSKEYDAHDLLACIVDRGSLQEYKAEYGPTILTAYAKINGIPVGIVANQKKHKITGRGEIEIGGVLYSESADKAARFVMDCNQNKLPLIFLQDVVGFMVGKDAEQSGIIRSGAKLVNAVSNSIVPKITVIVGNSFGAGNYALCGKAYDPNFIFAWPNAKYAVMGADQAANTLFDVEKRQAERSGQPLDEEQAKKKHEEIRQKFLQQMNIRYGAARGWVDAIIPPHSTREVLTRSLEYVMRAPKEKQTFNTGVIQV